MATGTQDRVWFVTIDGPGYGYSNVFDSAAEAQEWAADLLNIMRRGSVPYEGGVARIQRMVRCDCGCGVLTPDDGIVR